MMFSFEKLSCSGVELFFCCVLSRRLGLAVRFASPQPGMLSSLLEPALSRNGTGPTPGPRGAGVVNVWLLNVYSGS